MTRDEFTDTVASMTPRQREAMAVFGEATYCAALDGEGAAPEQGTLIRLVITGPTAGRFLLNAVYPNAIPETE